MWNMVAEGIKYSKPVRKTQNASKITQPRKMKQF